MNIKYRFVYSIILYIFLNILITVLAQNVKQVKEIGASLDQFALKFLAKTSNDAGESLNLALSPFTIWSLMVIISEGAQDNTALELEHTLGIPSSQNRDTFRKLYQELGNHLTKKDNPGVTLDISNSIFTAADQQLKPTFVQTAQNVYNTEISPINFKDRTSAASIINDRINTATKGRIINFVKEDDLTDAEVFMASTLHFKGAWDMKFNKTMTSSEDFYDDKGNQIGKVNMMYNFGPYPFALALDDKATIVELPYENNTMSMIVILPKRRQSLQSILDMLANTSFSDILDSLDKAAEMFGDEPVHIYLPKFRIISDLNLNKILHDLGITDVFSTDRANLLGMFNHHMYISRILQRAEIDVDEEGTEASSASGASFQYKLPPPKFLANKPFAYIIYNKETRGIIFAGKVSKPEKLK